MHTKTGYVYLFFFCSWFFLSRFFFFGWALADQQTIFLSDMARVLFNNAAQVGHTFWYVLL